MKAAISIAKTLIPTRLPLNLNLAMSTASDLNKLFVNEGQSAAYAEYRPSYGDDCPQVYSSLLKGLPSNDLAIDIATGTGQAVGPLARHFKHVIGERLMRMNALIHYPTHPAPHVYEDLPCKG